MSTHEIDESEDVHGNFYSYINIQGLHGRVKLKKGGTAAIEAGAWMDMERKNLKAYEYLCHVGEAKEYSLI
jgi:hypothetical protein